MSSRQGAGTLSRKRLTIAEIYGQHYRRMMAEVNRKFMSERYPDSAAVAYRLFCDAESSRDGFGQPFKLGLRPLGHDQVLIKDSNYEHDLSEKQRLFAEDPLQVWQALPMSADAQVEAFSYLFPNDTQPIEHALLSAGQRCQEDLVLMMLTDAGHVLAAGHVSFPSSWRLVEKIGKPMAQVHAPVPDFQEGTRTASMIERMFTKMRPSQPMVRMNWSLHSTDALRLPNSHDTPVDFHADGPALTLRIERQTLSKLPKTGAVLFTIRIFIEPLIKLKQHTDERHWGGLLRHLNSLNDDQKSYKGIRL